MKNSEYYYRHFPDRRFDTPPMETEDLPTYYVQDDYQEVHVCSECGGYIGGIGWSSEHDWEMLDRCEGCGSIEGDTEYVYENDSGDQISEAEFDALPLK